jgi:hypothetical protein
MTMILGSITVDDKTGAVTKSGVVGRCFDEIYAPVASVIPTGEAGVRLKLAIARNATSMGTVIFKILTEDARAVISKDSDGVQRMPASTAENTVTKPPASDKFLPIV